MSQLTEYSGFFPIMQTELPGCSTPAILAALRRAAREFCEDTEVWRPDTTVAIVPDDYQYNIHETDTHVRRIVCVRIVDTTVDSVTDPLAGFMVDANSYHLNAVAGTYYVRFHTPHIPSDNFDGHTLVVKRALVPDEIVDSLPDDFLTEWSTPIRDLALHELYATPLKPWSNADQAARYWDRYVDQRVRARFERDHQNKEVTQTATSGIPFAL